MDLNFKDDPEVLLSNIMGTDPNVVNTIKIPKKIAKYVFIGDMQIFLGRELYFNDVSVTREFKLINIGLILDSKIILTPKITDLCDQLVDDLSCQDFSVILESILRMRTCQISICMFKERIIKAGKMDSFIGAVTDLILRSSGAAEIQLDTDESNMKIYKLENTFLNWKIEKSTIYCFLEYNKHSALPDGLIPLSHGIYHYMAAGIYYDTFIPVTPNAFHWIGNRIHTKWLELLTTDCFKHDITTEMYLKFLIEIMEQSEEPTEQPEVHTFHDIIPFIISDHTKALTAISLCVGSGDSITTNVNGISLAFNVKTDTDDNSFEYAMEWNISGNDLILRNHRHKHMPYLDHPDSDAESVVGGSLTCAMKLLGKTDRILTILCQAML